MAIEEGQDGAPRASEQRVGQTVVCTHFENNCTQDENGIQGSDIRFQLKSYLSRSFI